MNPRRLYRSHDRQLAGVAGGMAEYLDIDPTIARILWILAAIVSGGLALLVYLVLALVVPAAPYAAPAYTGAAYPPAGAAPAASAGWSTATGGAPAWAPATPAEPAWGTGWTASSAPQAPRRAETRGVGAAAVVGVVLLVIGGIALADAVLPAWSAAGLMGPAVLLALGAALLVASIRRPVGDAVVPAAEVPPAPAPAGPVPTGDGHEATDTLPIDPIGSVPSSETA